MLHMARLMELLFLSTLSLRRATHRTYQLNARQAFLSTLSLRRATVNFHAKARKSQDFYPRSPCGERLNEDRYGQQYWRISIHALLAESDVMHALELTNAMLFLSTLSLRRATLTERRH